MARRHTAMAAIEAALQRLQGLVNQDEDKTPELGTRRGQSQACKKRPAQPSCPIAVVSHAARPAAPLALRYRVDDAPGQREAALDGGDLLGAGGTAAPRSEAARRAEWQGQYKVEHRFRRVPPLFLVPPWLLKTPQRMAVLVFLVMVGALMAGRLERQVRRAGAALQPPLQGLRPAGRDSVRPTVTRLFQAFADDSLVQGKEACGRVGASRLARLHPVQAPILALLGLPQPAEWWAQPVRVCVGAGEAWGGIGMAR